MNAVRKLVIAVGALGAASLVLAAVASAHATMSPPVAKPPRAASVARPARAARPVAAAHSHRRRRTAITAATSGTSARTIQGQSGGVAARVSTPRTAMRRPSTTSGTDQRMTVRPCSAAAGAHERASGQAKLSPEVSFVQAIPLTCVPWTSRSPSAVLDPTFAATPRRSSRRNGSPS